MSCGRNRAVKSNPEISGCTRSNPEVSTIYAVTEFSTNRNAPLYALRTIGGQELCSLCFCTEAWPTGAHAVVVARFEIAPPR